jgi:Protein of unknown function (DUF998)
VIPMLTRTTTSTAETTSTRVLLGCGAAAGPLFTSVSLVQVLTRDGFDLGRHPLSLLSLGDLGWVQMANFVVSGLLSLAFAVGLRRSPEPGWAGRWGPWLYAGFGLGMVVGGAFPTDPSDGFPPGIPEGSGSWHSLVHDIAAGVALDLALVSCLLLARRFRRAHQSGWASYSLLTGVAGLVLSWWPDKDGISVRLAVVVVLVLAWATALAVRLLQEPVGPAPARTDRA